MTKLLVKQSNQEKMFWSQVLANSLEVIIKRAMIRNLFKIQTEVMVRVLEEEEAEEEEEEEEEIKEEVLKNLVHNHSFLEEEEVQKTNKSLEEEEVINRSHVFVVLELDIMLQTVEFHLKKF